MSKNFVQQAYAISNMQCEHAGVKIANLQTLSHTKYFKELSIVCCILPIDSGGYRIRTDDPLRARQVL